MNEQNKQFEIFNHPQFGEITTVNYNNGKILFKGNDVAKALGYSELCKGN
jgi:prophage antirepressor-like protein